MPREADEADADAFMATAGFDFDTIEYQPPTEIDSSILRSQLDAITQRIQDNGDDEAADDEAHNGDNLLRVFDSDASCATLVVAFAALGGGGGGVPRHEFVGACKRAGATHAVFLKDPSQSWYSFGLNGSACFESVVAIVAREIAALQPSRVVLLGASMGGYAAIRAGLALSTRKRVACSDIRVLAFAPQIFLDDAERQLLELSPMEFDVDLRKAQQAWRSRSKLPGRERLPSAADALLLEATGKEEPSAAAALNIEVHVGAREAGDIREALLLREAASRSTATRVSVEVHPRLGHALVRDLRDRGELDALLRRFLGG